MRNTTDNCDVDLLMVNLLVEFFTNEEWDNNNQYLEMMSGYNPDKESLLLELRNSILNRDDGVGKNEYMTKWKRKLITANHKRQNLGLAIFQIKSNKGAGTKPLSDYSTGELSQVLFVFGKWLLRYGKLFIEDDRHQSPSFTSVVDKFSYAEVSFNSIASKNIS